MDAPEQIAAAAGVMGLNLEPEDATRMSVHLALLAEWNDRFNLTSIPRADWLRGHLLDSLSCTAELDESPAGPFADLGSGAGFPGVPLALVSNRQVVLVESVKKKATFLSEVLLQLQMGGTVEAVRAEELALRTPESFAAVTARALSALPSLVELAAPLLQRGGRLICLKGEPRAEEMDSGVRAAALCGMELVGSRRVTVPTSDARRTIVVYVKTGRSKIKLPRRPGMAQKQPLA